MLELLYDRFVVRHWTIICRARNIIIAAIADDVILFCSRAWFIRAVNSLTSSAKNFGTPSLSETLPK